VTLRPKGKKDIAGQDVTNCLLAIIISTSWALSDGRMAFCGVALAD